MDKAPMVGEYKNLNPDKLSVPPEPAVPLVVTFTNPLPPLLITAVIVVALTTVNEEAAVSPKLTEVVPKKPVPVIVTVAPSFALVGEKEVIEGGGIKVNPAKLLFPPQVITFTLPVAPILLTTAVIVLSLITLVEVAVSPPKVTILVPVNPVPLMVTVCPL